MINKKFLYHLFSIIIIIYFFKFVKQNPITISMREAPRGFLFDAAAKPNGKQKILFDKFKKIIYNYNIAYYKKEIDAR